MDKLNEEQIIYLNKIRKRALTNSDIYTKNTMERLIIDFSEYTNGMFAIAVKGLTYSCDFKIGDLCVHQGFYSIGNLEFRDTDEIERLEDELTIEYRLKYDSTVLSLMCFK